MEWVLLPRTLLYFFHNIQTSSPHLQLQHGARNFHAGTVLMARQVKRPVPTKAQLAAKARKKAAKAKKNIYDAEKMSLTDAISVLRVR